MSQPSLNWLALSKKLNKGKPVAPKKSVVRKKSSKVQKPAVQKRITTKTVQPEPTVVDNSRFFSTLYNEHSIRPHADLLRVRVTLVLTQKEAKGRYLAMDCEFVGVGPKGSKSALARVSIVNYYGVVIYDHYVRPDEYVTDWRTWVSGIEPRHMRSAVSTMDARKAVQNLVDGVIVIGHAIHNDLRVLDIQVNRRNIRDTSTLRRFKEELKSRTVGLKLLVKYYVGDGGENFQHGQHSSVEDARATMLMYKMFKNEFERARD